jgi:MT0933-like antitoxin protein
VSFLDGATEKLQELAKDHPEQVEQLSDQAITRGGDAIDSVTGGKYAEQLDQGQAKADGAIGEP